MMQRIRTLLGIGRATLIDDTGDLQLVQVTEGDVGGGIGDRVSDNVKRVGDYGAYAVPPLGSEVVVLYRGGDRNKPLVIATSHRPSRPRGKQPGDSGIYNGVTGAIVEMTDAGTVIDAGGLPITVKNFSSCTVEGDLHVTGDVISRAGGMPVSLNTLRDDYDEHTHTVTAIGSPTGLASKQA
jgi:phage baseplate assembly protein V